jgi:hypothetical protein
MYSPRIPETYIPLLYRLARRRGEPMTALVAEAVAAYLEREAPGGIEPDPAPPASAAPGERRLTAGRDSPPGGGGGMVPPLAPRSARGGGRRRCS